MRVVALLTCHNRRDLTVRCLRSYFSQNLDRRGIALEAVVVDDGSVDGTAEAVRERFAAARVLAGDGTLFWARGMRAAEAEALREAPDFLLWLNDDVWLDPTAVERLLETAAACGDAVVVGALRDPDSGSLTYSGVVLSRWHPLRVRLVHPGDRPVEADTFNGNVVLVPRAVYERVGPIDVGFTHGQADFDYGLRARELGFRVVVAPGSVGRCRRGGTAGTFYDASLPLRRRWELMQSPTGLPMKTHARYLRRHGGRLWPLFWAAPYVKLLANAVLTAPRRWSTRRA